MRQRTTAWSIALALLPLLVLGGAAAAQDSLGTIKSLYASAAYEDALTAIDRLRTAGPAPGDARGLDQYRAFCLLALGREGEATKALEDLVNADPYFAPDPNEVSPRVLTLFHGVRRRLLPPLVQQKYAMAKATYDRKEFQAAVDQFTRVVALMDDPDLDQKTAGLADLRMLAAGFLDLAKNAAAPPKPAQPAPPPQPLPPQPPMRMVFDASDPQVTPPVSVRQEFPPYPRGGPAGKVPVSTGAIEVTIDEMGRVERAIIRQSVNNVYDPLLLGATATWRYKPALRDGNPVKYRKVIQVNVDPTR